jgi:hypothetical protein
MRLKSDFWVKAYLRQVAAQGGQGFVVRHGDDGAGSIFIKVRRRDGMTTLFGPAPAGLDDGDHERRWVPFLKGAAVTEEAVDAAIAQEARFDSDLWVLEIESADGAHFLDGWLLATPQ